jgi:hypothetical protein
MFVNFICDEICTDCWHIGILKGSHSGCRFRASESKDLLLFFDFTGTVYWQLATAVCHPERRGPAAGAEGPVFVFSIH